MCKEEYKYTKSQCYVVLSLNWLAFHNPKGTEMFSLMNFLKRKTSYLYTA
jgi:hypothetical protein